MTHTTVRADGALMLTHQPHLSAEMRRLARQPLDDLLDDIFGPDLGLGPKLVTVKGARFQNPPHILARAAEITAERKAEAKARAAESRRLAAAERKRLKTLQQENPALLTEAQAAAIAPKARTEPKPKAAPTVLQGKAIPAEVTGTIVVTGTMPTRTGEAAIIDVVMPRNRVARGIVVWAGYGQTVARQLAEARAKATISVRQPANDRFRPSAGFVKAA